jgi:hypothetical protein
VFLKDDKVKQLSKTHTFCEKIIPQTCFNIIYYLCRKAVKGGGADVSEDAMEHAVNLFLKEMAYSLCDGYSVNTGWFTVKAQIRFYNEWYE